MKNKIFILALATLLASCLYEKGGVINPENVTGTTNTGSASTIDTGTAICDLLSGTGGSAATNENGEICFDTQILPLIVSNCATSGCHDSQSKRDGYDLTSYDKIVRKGVTAGNASKSKLYRVLNDTGEDRMPPAPKSRLSASQIKLIGDWIDQGAKNISCNTSSGTGGTLPDSVQISFSNHINPILDFYCVGCHTSGSASGGVNLNTYANVKTYVDNGRLYGSIAQQQGYSAMPVGSKLSDCQIMAFKQWIDQGALNN